MRKAECGMRNVAAWLQRCNGGRGVVALLSSLLFTSAMGCHDPRYEEAQAERNARIHSLFGRIEPRREKGMESIQKLGLLHRDLEVGRREHLRNTFDLVETRETSRKETWDSGDNRREWRRLFFGGHPERIDDTYSKMFY